MVRLELSEPLTAREPQWMCLISRIVCLLERTTRLRTIAQGRNVLYSSGRSPNIAFHLPLDTCYIYGYTMNQVHSVLPWFHERSGVAATAQQHCQ